MGGFILLIILLTIYFLPSIVGKDKENSTSIFLLNLLLGWTLVGWVVALVWATTKDNKITSNMSKFKQTKKLFWTI
ncbi:MAG: superinfection immunity protein [Saprospiraceae bacterium]|nr:superinfection immunity protein [Saprospiraceae bacterium]